MLDILRANTRSVLTYVLFGIIIVVFVVSFGPGSRGCTSGGVRSPAYAAKVNDQTITASEYEQHYGQLLQAYQRRAGQNFSRELADQLGLRSVAMNQVVEREMVIQEAARHGVAVSDDELSRAITEMPPFRTDGRFDWELYKRIATERFGSPAKFEERLRRDLVYQKMLAAVRETVKVSDEEVRQAWLKDTDKVSLQFVRFPVEAGKAEVKLGDADVKAFLAANGTRVEQYYKDHPDRFQKQKRVRARHILVKVDERAPPAEEEAAKKKIDDLAARVKRGEDFAKLASASSDDPGSREKGGELGFFGAGVMAKPFEDAAFALKPGEVSQPVRTRFGWHLIQVEAVQEPETVPLDKAKPEIARSLLEEDGARKIAARRAEDALAKVKAGKKLADLFPADNSRAPKLGGQPLHAESTGPFSESGEFVPNAGVVPGLTAAALQAQAGQVLPRVFDTAAGPIVAVVESRSKPDLAKFTEKKDELSERLRNRKEAQVEADWVKELRSRSKVAVNEAFTRGEVPIAPADLD